MPRAIMKLVDDKDNKEYYLIWSTIVDAPVTFGFELAEFREVMLVIYGTHGWSDLDEDIERADQKGISWLYGGYTADSQIIGNRAGFHEQCLSKEQIIEWYCRRKQNPSAMLRRDRRG